MQPSPQHDFPESQKPPLSQQSAPYGMQYPWQQARPLLAQAEHGSAYAQPVDELFEQTVPAGQE